MVKEANKKEIWGASFSAAIAAILLASLAFAIFKSCVGENALTDELSFYLNYALVAVALFCAVLVIKLAYKPEIGSFFKPIEKKYLLALPLVSAGCFLSFSSLNSLFIELLARFGYVATSATLPELSPFSVILCVLLVCLAPAVLEEVVFRGFILSSVKDFGCVAASLTSAALFSLYHTNPAQTVYQFVLGFIFAAVALKSGSVLSSVILHFLNNLVVLVICYAFPAWSGFRGVPLIISVLVGLALLFAGGYLIFFYKESLRNEPRNGLKKKIEKKEATDYPLISQLLPLLPGLVVAVATWIACLIS